MRGLKTGILCGALTLAAGAQTLSLGKVEWAAIGGAAAGVTLGMAGPNFDGYTGGERGWRQLRSGMTYGLVLGFDSAGLAAAWEKQPSEPHRFWWDKENTPLLAGIVAAQALDYTSTRYFRERGFPEWLLTNGEVDKSYAFVPTEIAAAGAGISLMYLLHRSGHHELERLSGAAYVLFGAVSAYANYRYPKTGHDLFGN